DAEQIRHDTEHLLDLGKDVVGLSGRGNGVDGSDASHGGLLASSEDAFATRLKQWSELDDIIPESGMTDRIEDWRMFVAVASMRSFAKAARSLGRSPQSATRSVAALEARLGTRLLARSTRAVSLTADGARHLDRARTLVAEFDALESPEAGPLRGVLVVTAPVLFGQVHVVRAVLEMTEAHPDLDVRLLLFDRVVSLADEGIDVALRIGALPDSSLRARRVGHVRSVVCASPEYLDRAGRPR